MKIVWKVSVTGLFLIVISLPALADDYNSSLPISTEPSELASPALEPSEQDSFHKLKSRVREIVDENDRLSTEYTSFQETIEKLQSVIAELDKKSKEWKGDTSSFDESISEYKERLGSLNREIKILESEVDLKGKKTASLKEDKVKLDQEEKAWQDQIVQLKVQIEALEAGQKNQEEASQQRINQQGDELTKLKTELAQNQQEEKRLEEKLIALRSQTESSPRALAQLREENRKLQKQISDANENRQEALKKIKHARNQTERIEATIQNKYLMRLQERDLIERKVSALEDDLKDINDTTNISMDVQEQKKILMNEFISLHDVNETLRIKTDELKNQIAGMKKDIAMLEGLQAIQKKP